MGDIDGRKRRAGAVLVEPQLLSERVENELRASCCRSHARSIGQFDRIERRSNAKLSAVNRQLIASRARKAGNRVGTLIILQAEIDGSKRTAD